MRVAHRAYRRALNDALRCTLATRKTCDITRRRLSTNRRVLILEGRLRSADLPDILRQIPTKINPIRNFLFPSPPPTHAPSSASIIVNLICPSLQAHFLWLLAPLFRSLDVSANTSELPGRSTCKQSTARGRNDQSATSSPSPKSHYRPLSGRGSRACMSRSKQHDRRGDDDPRPPPAAPPPPRPNPAASDVDGARPRRRTGGKEGGENLGKKSNRYTYIELGRLESIAKHA